MRLPPRHSRVHDVAASRAIALNSFTQIGAIAAFAALVGIAVLSLLVFSQAREIKRLREWAGRAPERAAEMEQRVTATAAQRAQQRSPRPGPCRAPLRSTPHRRSAAGPGAAPGAQR